MVRHQEKDKNRYLAYSSRDRPIQNVRSHVPLQWMPVFSKVLFRILFHDIPGELPKHEEKYELHRLIAALLSNQLNEQQRLAILESEYNIPINTDFRKDVNVMCNLGQGIEDRAIAETTAKIILNMYHSGYSLTQIADAVEMTETEVLDIITSASA